MANALTTLMQYAIHEIVKDRVEFELGEEIHAEAFFLNDDGVVFFKDENTCTLYSDLDMEVTEELGLLPKAEKSFISYRASVFCENYFFNNQMSEKRSYYAREYNLCLNAVNIVHAK